MENKYIGNKKINLVPTVLTEKTPAQNEMVEVNFEDGTKEVMPKLRFQMIVTDEISDASAVQQKIQSHVGSVLYGTLHEYGILMGEVEEVLNAVSTITNNGYEKARDIKWGVTHRFLPLIEINKVMLEYNAKQSNNGAAPAGGGADTQDKK